VDAGNAKALGDIRLTPSLSAEIIPRGLNLRLQFICCSGWHEVYFAFRVTDAKNLALHAN